MDRLKGKLVGALVLAAMGSGPRTVRAAGPQDDSESMYEQEKITVTTAMLSPGVTRSGAYYLHPRRFVPTKGGNGLKGVHFYDVIERPDLAATYRKRIAIRWGLFGGGAALFVGGLGVALAGVLRDPQNNSMKITGSVIMVTGLLTTTAAGIYARHAPAHPIEPAVAKNLIDEYNADLRTQLGLKTPTAHVRVQPQLTAAGAGISVSGRF